MGMRLKRIKTNEGKPVPNLWLVRGEQGRTWQQVGTKQAAQWYAKNIAQPGEKGSNPDTSYL